MQKSKIAIWGVFLLALCSLSLELGAVTNPLSCNQIYKTNRIEILETRMNEELSDSDKYLVVLDYISKNPNDGNSVSQLIDFIASKNGEGEAFSTLLEELQRISYLENDVPNAYEFGNEEQRLKLVLTELAGNMRTRGYESSSLQEISKEVKNNQENIVSVLASIYVDHLESYWVSSDEALSVSTLLEIILSWEEIRTSSKIRNLYGILSYFEKEIQQELDRISPHKEESPDETGREGLLKSYGEKKEAKLPLISQVQAERFLMMIKTRFRVKTKEDVENLKSGVLLDAQVAERFFRAYNDFLQIDFPVIIKNSYWSGIVDMESLASSILFYKKTSKKIQDSEALLIALWDFPLAETDAP